MFFFCSVSAPHRSVSDRSRGSTWGIFDLAALPSVRVRPSSAVVVSSSDTRLLCESEDTPFLAVAYWTHAGQRIDLSPSLVEMHGNELRLFQFGDTAYTQPGAYACVVSTRYGLMESEASMLSLPSKSFAH